TATAGLVDIASPAPDEQSPVNWLNVFYAAEWVRRTAAWSPSPVASSRMRGRRCLHARIRSRWTGCRRPLS
ncbi:hypothetical protein CTI14_50900, partial [Methylobacterium radiotolerans]